MCIHKHTYINREREREQEREPMLTKITGGTSSKNLKPSSCMLINRLVHIYERDEGGLKSPRVSEP